MWSSEGARLASSALDEVKVASFESKCPCVLAEKDSQCGGTSLGLHTAYVSFPPSAGI